MMRPRRSRSITHGDLQSPGSSSPVPSHYEGRSKAETIGGRPSSEKARGTKLYKSSGHESLNGHETVASSVPHKRTQSQNSSTRSADRNEAIYDVRSCPDFSAWRRSSPLLFPTRTKTVPSRRASTTSSSLARLSSSLLHQIDCSPWRYAELSLIRPFFHSFSHRNARHLSTSLSELRLFPTRPQVVVNRALPIPHLLASPHLAPLTSTALATSVSRNPSTRARNLPLASSVAVHSLREFLRRV
jgi:hypothetical protein